MRCAHHLPGSSQRCVIIHAGQLGESEVRNSHVAGFRQQNILRLDVTMDHTVIVCVLQRRTDLRDDVQRGRRTELTDSFHMPQIRPVNELHDEEVQRILSTKVVHRNDVGMVQLCQSPRFSQKSLCKTGILADVGPQNFQRDDAVKFNLTSFVDHAHAAMSKDLQNLQLRKMRSQFFNGRRDERGTIRRRTGFSGSDCWLRLKTNLQQTLRTQ